MAATLASGPPGVASHRTAARSWALEGMEDDVIEVLVLRGAKRPRWDGVVAHRTQWVDVADVSGQRCGIRVVSVGLCLLQLAGSVHPHRVEQALDDPPSVGGWSPFPACVPPSTATGYGASPASPCSTSWSSSGSAPVGRSARCPEQDLIRLLRAHGFPEPTTQHEVVLDGHRHYVDVAYPEALLAIEYDGEQYHRTRRAFHADPLRRNRFEAAGWTYLVVTARSLRDPGELLAQLRLILAQSGGRAA